jgi:uncharacterized cupredoxin-like copper-binding protein
MRHRGALITSLAVVVVGLAAASIGAMVAANHSGTTGSSCAVAALPGTTVHVTLTNMGMAGGGMTVGNGMMGGSTTHAMRVTADAREVPAGRVSLVATNAGSITHELVVLPLSAGQAAGGRVTDSNGRVDEAGSLGEASKSCGRGAGEGITPHTAGWVTLDLAPGRYELLCNLPGHYAAGMYTVLRVE